MGARGKKWRRNDGNVETVRLSRTPQLVDFPLDPVPAAALADAMLEYIASEFIADDQLRDSEDRSIVDAVAEQYGLDVESLEMRADRLAMFMQRRGDFLTATDSTSISIDPALLSHAASVAMRSSDELTWAG
ncbi:hypothetical protein [Sphingomonas sp. UYP23]